MESPPRSAAQRRTVEQYLDAQRTALQTAIADSRREETEAHSKSPSEQNAELQLAIAASLKHV